MPTIKQYLNEIVAQKKTLATNITSKGITASETELLNTLVPKVAQIENLKGEEKVLENFTNILDEPKSIVQLEYPEPKNLFDKDNANIIIGYPDAENAINPATTTRTVYISCAPNTTYTVSKTVTARFCVAFADVLPASGVTVTGRIQNNTAASITATSSADSKYIVVWVYHTSYDTSITLDEVLATLQIEKGTTATTYEPYPVKTLNAKLGSKNLLSVMSLYPTVTQNATPIYFKAGETYTFSMTSTYEQYRLMLFGTDINGGAFDATSEDADKYVQGMYTGAAGRLQNKGNQTSKTLSLKCKTDCIITAVVLWNTASETDKTYSNFQLEVGSTATDYTPYISDFSTVTTKVATKNLASFDSSLTRDSNGISWTINSDGTVHATGTLTTGESYFYTNDGISLLPLGVTYTISDGITEIPAGIDHIDFIYANQLNGADIDGALCRNGVPVTFTTKTIIEKPNFLVSVYGTVGTTIDITFKPQIEVGTVATDYETYQTPTSYSTTASGEVSNISNKYPITNLLTDNLGVVFTNVDGEIYKTIIPSEGKNGITKVLQPAVDSTIDSNITSDNIKKDVSILGVTGDYICNYTYDETSKELVLLI